MSDLPRGWIEATVAELSCVNPKHAAEIDRSQMVTFIPMPAVDEWSGSIADKSAVKPLADLWKGYTHFADGDVIFAKITPCMENGKIAVAEGLTNGMACGSTEFHVVRPQGAVEPIYLWRYFRQKSFRGRAERAMTGAVGQRRVPRQFLEKAEIPLPPMAEQKRIVAKLDGLSAKSARARTELARIETLVSRYKQAVLGKAFSGGLTRSWRSNNPDRLYGPDDLSELNLDSGERGVWLATTLPAEWEWRRFKDVFTDLTDSNRKLPQKEYLAEGQYPVVDQGAMKFGGYTDRIDLVHPANPPFIVFGDHTRCVKYIEHQFVQGADGVKVLHTNSDVLPLFACLALSAVEMPDKGYARHMKFVRSTVFPVAPLPEQAEIVRRIESAFVRIDRLAAEAKRALELLGRLDEAILAKAFRGELVPQDENDEPASVLLDRIQAERAAAPTQRRGRKA